MDERITLSSNQFKALASETRAEIIKLLQQRNHTLTELSKKLSLAAPTVKQHLSVLQQAQLIMGLDEGRKWKYYSLTRKGKGILSAETPANILIVLGVTMIALAGIAWIFVSIAQTQPLVLEQRLLADDTYLGKAAIGPAPSAAEVVTGGTALDKNAGAEGEMQVGSSRGMPVARADSIVGSVERLSIQLIALLFAAIAAALLAGFFLGKLKRKRTSLA